MFYVPGLTHFPSPQGSPVFQFIDPLKLKGLNKYPKEERETSGTNGGRLFNKILKTHHQTESLENKDVGRRCQALVEQVDLFPTIVDLVGLKPLKTCPKDSHSVQTCTEGFSFSDLISSEMAKGKRYEWKKAAFSQYPRPSELPEEDSDKPRLRNIKIMGYSMRTHLIRYTEWIGFDPTHFQGNWSDIRARELYFHSTDSLEDNNLANDKRYTALVAELSVKLKRGWRASLPSRVGSTA